VPPSSDANPAAISRAIGARLDSARLHGEGSHPPAIGVYPVTHALRAIEPERAAGVPVNAGIMAQVSVLTRTRLLSGQPLAFGFGELRRRSHVPYMRQLVYENTTRSGPWLVFTLAPGRDRPIVAVAPEKAIDRVPPCSQSGSGVRVIGPYGCTRHAPARPKRLVGLVEVRDRRWY
jgi:hypothetical protein